MGRISSNFLPCVHLLLLMIAPAISSVRSAFSFSLPDIIRKDGITLSGDATVKPNGVLTLNRRPPYSSGRVFLRDAIPLLDSSTSFLFVLQICSANTTEGGSAFLIAFQNRTGGYQHLRNAIPFALHFDTFPDQEFGGPSALHLGVHVRSVTALRFVDLSSPHSYKASPRLQLKAWIDYHSQFKLLEVFLSKGRRFLTKPPKPMLSMPMDFSAMLRQEAMFIRFSAAGAGAGDCPAHYAAISWNVSVDATPSSRNEHGSAHEAPPSRYLSLVFSLILKPPSPTKRSNNLARVLASYISYNASISHPASQPASSTSIVAAPSISQPASSNSLPISSLKPPPHPAPVAAPSPSPPAQPASSPKPPPHPAPVAAPSPAPPASSPAPIAPFAQKKTPALSVLPPAPRFPSQKTTPSKDHPRKTAMILITLAVVIVAAVSVGVLFAIKRRADPNPIWEMQVMADAPRSFSYKELRKATQNFSSEVQLGQGGFGSVYKGTLEDGSVVAIKKISDDSKQGLREFLAEVQIIGRVRHRNLVVLRGWCYKKGKMLLVYDFMPNGSLDRKRNDLSWESRFKVIDGVAAAIAFLHDGWEQRVLHRDVKASNVMLDADFSARLGDFGLARLVEHNSLHTQPITGAGTLGYVPPEVVYTGKTTEKSDVYSFGILVLEVATGHPPLDPFFAQMDTSLVNWVWELNERMALLEAADPNLAGNFDGEQMRWVLQIGLLCCHPSSAARPSMRYVCEILKGDITLPAQASFGPVPTFSLF